MSNFRLLLFLTLQLFAVQANAQRFRNGVTELGLMGGFSNYFGDIAPEIVWGESHPAFGLLYKYHHSRYFSSRYQFSYASISGKDKYFNGQAFRNIQFNSNIYEMGYFMEFNFKPFGINANQHEETGTTYVFSGVNLFMFEPTVTLPKGDELSLRDLGTEGQVINGKRTYSLIQPALSLGLGYKFNIRRKTVIGLEIGFRKTFTDYLDDTKNDYADYATIVAKQGSGTAEYAHPETLSGAKPIRAGVNRGDANFNDWYFIAGITICFRNVIGDPCARL